MNKVEEYLQKIRELNGLKNALLGGITVSRREKSAEFFLITDKAYTEGEVQAAQSISQEYLPAGITAKMKIVKRVPDKEIVKKKIFEFVSARFPA